jgi:hypothetical protein
MILEKEIGAKDLRIGNYVYFPTNIFKSKTDEMQQVVDVLCDSINTHHIEGLNYGLVVPIALTEAFLFGLGFQKYKDSDIPTYFKNFGNHDGEDFEYCFVIFEDAKGNYYTQIMGKKIILNYAHTLQNLFFDISDEEKQCATSLNT